jgi:hypothetical protein
MISRSKPGRRGARARSRRQEAPSLHSRGRSYAARGFPRPSRAAGSGVAWAQRSARRLGRWRVRHRWRPISRRRRWRPISRVASLFRERRQILLTRLQGGRVFGCGSLKVHPKPYRPNYNANNASGDVLDSLHALLVSKLLSLSVIGLYFGPDHRAVRISVLRLHTCYGRRIAASASRQGEADGHRRTDHLRTLVVAPLSASRPPGFHLTARARKTRRIRSEIMVRSLADD